MRGPRTNSSSEMSLKCWIMFLSVLLTMLLTLSPVQSFQLCENDQLELALLDSMPIYNEKESHSNLRWQSPPTCEFLNIFEEDSMKLTESLEQSEEKHQTQKEQDFGSVMLWQSRQTPQAQLSWEIPPL